MDSVYVPNKELIKNELSLLVEDFLSKHEKLSISWLAKKVGKSEGAIRHALNPQNSIIAGPDTVLKIVSIINKKNDINTVIESAPYHTQLYLKKCFPMFIDNNSVINNDLPEIDSLETFIIFMACQKPLHKSVLIDLCGVKMARKINELSKAEVISTDENGYITRNRRGEGKEFLSPDEVLKFAPLMYSFVDMENLSGTFTYTTCINASPAFKLKVGAIMDEAFKRIQREHDKMENQGEHRLFLTFLADTINKSSVLLVFFLSFVSGVVFADEKHKKDFYFDEKNKNQIIVIAGPLNQIPIFLKNLTIIKPDNNNNTEKARAGGDDSGVGGMK